MWRATAGACGGDAPLLERSTDGGTTWRDVTPNYLGVSQILALGAFASTEAEMVARVGPNCEVQALRTFTQGSFWEPYPEVLAGSTYVDPTNPATVIVSGAAIGAPCPAPWGVRADSGVVGVVCDGVAYNLIDRAWQPVTEDALALSAEPDGLTVAAMHADCPGMWIVPPDPRTAACAADIPAQPPAAVDGSLIWVSTDVIPVGN